MIVLNFTDEDGTVREYRIDELIELSALKLTHDLVKYFAFDSKTLIIDTHHIILSHIREKGISNALKFMKEAYDGDRAKRSPILVQPLQKNFYRVLDGNSTLAIALAARWPTIACELQTH